MNLEEINKRVEELEEEVRINSVWGRIIFTLLNYFDGNSTQLKHFGHSIF